MASLDQNPIPHSKRILFLVKIAIFWEITNFYHNLTDSDQIHTVPVPF